MPVVRIKFPDRTAVESVARLLDGEEGWRGAREVRRAAERRGRIAELGTDEVYLIRDQLLAGAYVVPRMRALLEDAITAADEAVARDAARVRPGDWIQAMRGSR